MKVQRNPATPRVLSVRPMVEADLEALRQPSHRQGLVRPLRDSHYMIARLMALGLKNYEIAERVGYSHQRISLLRSDPAMIERVAVLRKQLDDKYLEEGDTIREMGLRAMTKYVRQINDHLDDADERGELLPIKDLVAIGPDLMDRFGYGKKATNVNVNIDMAKHLEAAIAKKREREAAALEAPKVAAE